MDRKDNRAEILRVALDLFAARGYDATGVKEIVEAVGIGKPTLYHYFGSKQGLLEALVSEQAGPFLEDLALAATYHKNLPATLKAIVRAYLGFASAQPTFFRFLLSLLFVPPGNEAHGPAAATVARMEEILRTMFQKAAGDHGNMRGRDQRYAYAFLGVLTSAALLVMNGGVAPDEQFQQQLVQQFSHGIYS